MNRDEVARRVDAALAILRTADRRLFTAKVHERSLTHRLAVYLEHAFDGWNVDCEYDLKGIYDDKKQVVIEKPKGVNPEDADVYPDIIVHHRTRQELEHNLLVIEAKWRGGDVEYDCRKIEAFVGLGHPQTFKYQHGLLLILDEDGTVTKEWPPFRR